MGKEEFEKLDLTQLEIKTHHDLTEMAVYVILTNTVKPLPGDTGHTYIRGFKIRVPYGKAKSLFDRIFKP